MKRLFTILTMTLYVSFALVSTVSASEEQSPISITDVELLSNQKMSYELSLSQEDLTRALLQLKDEKISNKRNENSNNTGSSPEALKETMLSMMFLILFLISVIVALSMIGYFLPSFRIPRDTRGYVPNQEKEIINSTSLEFNLEALVNNEESDDVDIPVATQEEQSRGSSDTAPGFRVIRTENDKRTTTPANNSETRRVIRY